MVRACAEFVDFVRKIGGSPLHLELRQNGISNKLSMCEMNFKHVIYPRSSPEKPVSLLLAFFGY